MTLPIAYTGQNDAFDYRLLSAGAPVDVVALGCDDDAALSDILAGKTVQYTGVALDSRYYTAAIGSVMSSDGLAKTVRWADSIAFAGGIEGGFGFLSFVTGMVEAIRSATGVRYLDAYESLIIGSGPELWAAQAVLTQLKAPMTVAFDKYDAMAFAVGQRLGIETTTQALATVDRCPSLTVMTADIPDVEKLSSNLDENAILVATVPVRADILEAWSSGGATVISHEAVRRHTVAHQIRLFTSREPNWDAMEAVHS